MNASFEFETTEIFGLFGRGLVFRGQVLTGEVSLGDQVSFKSVGQLVHTARVDAIECDRKLIPKSVPGQEIGLLLIGFGDGAVNRMIHNAPDDPDQVDGMPTPETVLDVSLPLKMERA